MLLNWFCLLVLVNLHNADVSALPAQKFAPGIPITPTANQTPGGVRGVIEDSATGSIDVSAPSNIQSVRHYHQGYPHYLESNSPFLPSQEYAGWPHRVHVHPDGVFVRGPPHPLHPAVRHAVCSCIRSNIYGNRFGPGPFYY